MFQSGKRAKLTRDLLKDIGLIGVQMMPNQTRLSRQNSDFATSKKSSIDHRGSNDHFFPETVNLLELPNGASSESTHPSPPLVTQTYACHSLQCNTVKNASLQEHTKRGMKLSKKDLLIDFKRKRRTVHSFEVNLEGPCTRRRYHLSKPNTRSRQRYVSFKLNYRRCCCMCDSSDEVLNVKQSYNKIKCGKSRTTKSKVVHAAKKQEKDSGARKTHLPPVAKRTRRVSLRDKQSNRTPFRFNIKREREARQGQLTVKERPTQSATDRTAAADTDFLSTGLSNINTTGNVHSCSNCLEVSTRSVNSSSCAVYGDCEYIYSQSKNLYKSAITRLKPKFKVEAEKANTIIIKAPEKIIVWVGKYPELKVCDVAQACNVCRHGCGYVLPEVLKSKGVHCFKQDLKAGVRLLPTCSAGNKHGSEAGINSTHSSAVHLGKRHHQFQRLTEHSRREPQNYTAGKTLRNHVLSDLLEVTTREASAAYTLPANHASKVKGSACLLNRSFEQDPGEEATIHVKRRRVERIKTMSIASQSCLDSELEGSDIVGSMGKTHGGQRAVPTENGALEVSLEGDILDNCSNNDAEQFSCQRARVYFRKNNFSCARTYMPFCKIHPLPATPEMEACPTEPDTSPRDEPELSLNPAGDLSLSLNVKTSVMFPNVSTYNSSGSLYLPQRDIENSEVNEMAALFTWKKQRESDVGTVTTPSFDDGGFSTYSCSQVSSVIGLDTSDTTFSCYTSSSCTPNDLDRFSATYFFQLNQNVYPSSTLPMPCLSENQETIRKPVLTSEETGGPSLTSSAASSPATSSASSYSCESYLLLPQNELSTKGHFPKSVEDHTRIPFGDVSYVRGNESNRTVQSLPDEWSDIASPWSFPLLSPISSPQRPSSQILLSQTLRCPEPEDNIDNFKAFSVTNGEEDYVNDHCSKEGHIVGSNEILEKDPNDAEVKAAATLGALMGPSDGGGDRASDADKETLREDKMAADRHLDEVTAYEQDILLVDIVQDDPDLFVNLPKKRILKLGPIRKSGSCGPVKVVSHITGEPAVSTRTDRPSWETDKYASTAATQHSRIRTADLLAILHEEDESSKRTWRASSSKSLLSQQCSSDWLLMDNRTKTPRQLKDDDNNQVMNHFERVNTNQTLKSLNGITTPSVQGEKVNTTEFRFQKSSSYCRLYFSDSLACHFKMCRFQHAPLEGDEKFCVETVMRFTKNPLCLQKASAVFSDYYQKNPPGLYFSQPALTSLLWALLKANLVSDMISVLNTILEHKITPASDFVLAMLNHTKEKGTTSAPQILGFMSKMADAGLVQSVYNLNRVQNGPSWQQTISPVLPVNIKWPLLANASISETNNLVHALMEIELCTKQEDWGRIGHVFRSFRMSGQGPNELERVSEHIAIALLSETKDKLSLPFASFSDAVTQVESDEDDLIKSFLGRIGVSLMFRYYRTHQWTKGRKVLEVLTRLKVNFSMLKGLFGNENGASRCCLVTMATELFLLSGSVEGALHTLRENEWFLSSHLWPCEPCDLDKRRSVLIRLTEKTSHRDTLEVLSNLPGLKESCDSADISEYGPLFNSHLSVCLERQMLPVASDTVVLMLSKKLPVEGSLLHVLLNKLGKQNLWLRARKVFKCSLSLGYFPGVYAPPGLLGLTVPCKLGEVELALTLEMFVTVNATSLFHLTDDAFCLTITLKRSDSCERTYLDAASRLLSAAGILQPKLNVSFTVVNASQEQVFKVDIPSARCWLRQNHMWANTVWTQPS